MGINLNTFTYMRGKLLQSHKQSKITKFIPVTIKEGNNNIEAYDVIIESENGIKLRIPSTIAPENFRQRLALI